LSTGFEASFLSAFIGGQHGCADLTKNLKPSWPPMNADKTGRDQMMIYPKLS
jgi:hypothetical protein